MTTSTASPSAELTAPVKMTVQPDSSGNASGTFQVINSGSAPLHITEHLGRVTSGALHYPAASGATLTTMGQPWLTVSPSSFTLAPHSAETVHISASVPSGAQGAHYLNVIWVATGPQAAASPLRVSGAIATTVGIPLPGTAQPVAAGHALPRALPMPGHGGGFSTMDAGGALCAALVVAAAGTVAVRRLRRRGRHAGAGRAA